MIESFQEDLVDVDVGFELIVVLDDIGKWLDVVLVVYLEIVSCNRIQVFIKVGYVIIDGWKIVELKYWVNEDSYIIFIFLELEDLEFKGEVILILIVFEDEYLVVVDKFVSFVVYFGVGNWIGILVNVLIYYCGDSLLGIGGVKWFGIVYWIDKDILGFLVVVKMDEVYQGFVVQFVDYGKIGFLEWVYVVFVWGVLNSFKGIINVNLVWFQVNWQKIVVVKISGCYVVIYWQVKERFG